MHLVVPQRSTPVSGRRRAVVLLLGGVALGGAGGVAWIAANRVLGDGQRRRLTLGVGPFRTSGPEEAVAWIGPALRDGLNTQLTGLTGVQVFSEEFMDFIMSRERLTTIELANRLGIEKMVSGTVVVGDTVRVEARIIDVATGLLEGAYVTSGHATGYLALERDVVLGVIAKLAVRLSPEDEARAGRPADHRPRRAAAAARRRREGGGRPPPAPALTDRRRASRSPPLGAPRPARAWADDTGAAIAASLEAYRRATRGRGRAGTRRPVRRPPGAAAGRARALLRDRAGPPVAIDQVEVAVVGDEAVVSFTRTDDFVDVPIGAAAARDGASDQDPAPRRRPLAFHRRAVGRGSLAGRRGREPANSSQRGVASPPSAVDHDLRRHVV